MMPSSSKLIKKIAKSLLTAFLLINLALTISAFQFDSQNAHASISTRATSSLIAQSPISDLDSVGGQKGLPNFVIDRHSQAPIGTADTPGVGTIGSIAYVTIDIVKFIMSTVAFVMIVVIAIKLVVGGSDEETVTKAKKGLAVAILGLLVIQLADILVKKVFFGEGSTAGTILSDETSAEEFALEGVAELSGIIGMVQVALGAVAVLVIIINGIRIMVTGTEEENRKKGLKNIGFAAGGLILVVLSDFIVRAIVFPDQGASLPSGEDAKKLFVMITNFISGFVATISFVMFLYAGYTYVAAGSEETAREKVKKLLLGAVIGLILALGAYAITNTLITFQEDNEFIPTEQFTEDQPQVGQ